MTRLRLGTLPYQRAALGFLGFCILVMYGVATLLPPSAPAPEPAVEKATPQARVEEPAPSPSPVPAPAPSTPAPVNKREASPARSLARSLGKPVEVIVVSDANKLHDLFTRLGYHLDHVREGLVTVPRLYLASLPSDLKAMRSIDRRKAMFIKTMLPLVLQVNETVLADRRRLLDLRDRIARGEELSERDRAWLSDLAARHGVGDGDLEALVRRVDVIPPSLAVAQAAEETGWGTSRFVHQGNAAFGQWTYEDEGLVPRERPDGAAHRVRAFDHLIDGVRAYAVNLNTHRAYREFRQARAEMRQAGESLDGLKLAATLTRYSKRGRSYVRSLRTIIRANNLGPLDTARLRSGSLASLDPS